MSNINTSKSAGPDQHHPRPIKECAEILVEPLAKLYQKSLDSGVVPDSWKESVVSPIFKKGARNSAANYRPVSLTAILCKILEDLVREEVVSHLITNNLLTKRQFGFIKGRSTVLQLLTFIDEAARSLAAGGGRGHNLP